jgi:hypothetical protein
MPNAATLSDRALSASPNRTFTKEISVQFDDLLRRYFATDDLAAITPAAMSAGVERMRVDFGMESDRARRFALWTMMHMFGVAPDLDVAFANEADRNAARDFMDLAQRAEDGSD